jgi:hypothetical protein
MTPAQARTLATLKVAMAVIAEVRALPEQDEFSLHRAIVAAKAANESCLELEASMAAGDLFARLGVTA